MYKKLVLYIEVCESGSMMLELPQHAKNVYAITAADYYESIMLHSALLIP